MPFTVALGFAYDGTAFDSYARQPGKRTVEGCLVDGLAKHGLMTGSFRSGSRTDRAVSAAQNVARATVERPHIRGLIPALQGDLPPGLWATRAAAVEPTWNPRIARRRYEYDAPANGEDWAIMRAAAATFEGTHDMRAFARLDGRKPERTIHSCQVDKESGDWRITVEGDGFLWNQVRRMAHAILQAGAGRVGPEGIQAALASGVAGKQVSGLAPPEGLLLAAVDYPGLQWDAAAGGLHAGRLAVPLAAARRQSRLLEKLATNASR